MDLEFHPSQWLDILRQEPVIVILLGGLIGGMALTQTVKLIWFTFNIYIGVRPYNLAVVLFATISTFIITDHLWDDFGLTTGTGLKHVGSFISALTAPYAYKGAKALVAVRWPNFADKWGDDMRNGKNGTGTDHRPSP